MAQPGIFRVAVAALIEKDDKILITKRSATREHAPNEWEAGITGRVDQNERMEDAVVREVKEETSLEIKVIVPFSTFHFYRNPDKSEHQGVNFWCKYVAGEVTLDTNEQSEYKWVTLQEAFSYITDPEVIRELKTFIEFKKRYTP